MCNVNKGFKFCTCSDLSAALYTWYLTRYLGIDEDGPVGSIIGPAHDLGKGLTAASVLEVLNGGNAFDFDYAPVEKDCLRITFSDKKGKYGYMSFIYTAGSWEVGMTDAFRSITEELGKGEVDV